ncbi:MAG: hypothetical protein CUN55_12420 [Phototrophicales bacterium]|nr:MAG: hypothetical protein CUN55_12420 [Phototrophicales bacterium]
MSNSLTLTLTPEQIATLNNIRTILKRQLTPLSPLDEQLVADLLVKQANLMRDAGLATELMTYLETAIARADTNTAHYRRLQLQLALTMLHLGDYEDTVREIYNELLDFYSSQPVEERTDDYAYAMMNFGRYFANRGQNKEAITYYKEAVQQFQKEGLEHGIAEALTLIGKSLQAMGQFDQAQQAYNTALGKLTNSQHVRQRATIISDYADLLLQSGNISAVEEWLEQAYELCEQHGFWELKAKVIRQQAYSDQLRARAASEQALKQQWLHHAATRLHHAIASLLIIQNTNELAVTYHDLGRLEAQLNDLEAAEAHVRKSCELFTRIGNRRNFAVSEITLGQILLVKNHNIDEALQHIRQALYIAHDVQDMHTREQAARALLKIHQMQVQRAKDKPDNIKADVLEDVNYTQERLARLGMNEFAQSASQLSAQLIEEHA